MLLPMLCTLRDATTTSCSKGSQGLRFPLDDTGIFTGQWFQKVLVRDSDYLIEPFMHVAIQTTRHYATLSTKYYFVGLYHLTFNCHNFQNTAQFYNIKTNKK